MLVRGRRTDPSVPSGRGQWVSEKAEPPGKPSALVNHSEVRREIREKPSRQIIPNFILIDTNDPTICYAI